jgi:hypothetical protein
MICELKTNTRLLLGGLVEAGLLAPKSEPLGKTGNLGVVLLKSCFKCKQLKQIDEFYAHPMMADGHLGKCKECNKKDVQQNYRANRNHYRIYEQIRAATKHRKKWRTEEQRKRRASNPLKTTAHYMISNAIRDKRLVRMPCEKCGNPKSEAHHDDYSKPLEVRWLCFKHHREHHGQQVT